MRDLLKRAFNLLVKTIWLKEIDKATKQYENAKTKANQKLYVLGALLDAYEEKYGFCSYVERREGE